MTLRSYTARILCFKLADSISLRVKLGLGPLIELPPRLLSLTPICTMRLDDHICGRTDTSIFPARCVAFGRPSRLLRGCFLPEHQHSRGRTCHPAAYRSVGSRRCGL